MRILVTGGAGFIGANFIRRTLQSERRVTILNVDHLGYAANLSSLEDSTANPSYSFRQLDISNFEDTKTVIDGFSPELVVHFAAESHVDRSISGPLAFLQSNVIGTFSLLQACLDLHRRQPLLFHHVSTDEVYGSLGATGYFTEETAFDPSSPYSASKAASDHFVKAFHRTYGLPIKISNCSNNYGPFQFPEKLVPLMILNAAQGKELPVYGDGLNIRDWLHVHDHVDAIWAIIERGRVGETYNVGGNNEATNLELVQLLCRLVDEKLNRPEGTSLGLIKFVKDRPGHDQRYAIDASKLSHECSWKPQFDINSGMRATVDWYLTNSSWVNAAQDGSYRQWIESHYAGALGTKE